MNQKKKKTTSKQVNMRIKTADYEKLKLNASALGMKVTTYAKARIESDSLIRPKFHAKATKYFNYELARIGNNINQLARVANQNKNSLYDNSKLINELITQIDKLDQRTCKLWQSLK